MFVKRKSMAIIVYNRTREDHSANPNNYPIFRGVSILSNPYTHIKDKATKAFEVVDSREEAIELYERYFDAMYENSQMFKDAVDEIYEKYKSGEDVYLECYCAPQPCHGDIIKRKLEQRLIKEKINQRLNGKNIV